MVKNNKPLEGEMLTPIPRKKGQSITMSFSDAVREIIKGNKVRRLEWSDQSDYCLLKDGWLSIYINGKFHVWKISDGDMIETQDWVIFNETN